MKLSLVIAVLMIVLSPPLMAKSYPEAVAKVIVVMGQAYGRYGQNEQRLLRRGDDVYLKDVLTTAINSRLHLSFYDQTQITLGASTQLTVRDFPLPASNSPYAALDFAKGAFRIVTGAITRRSDPNFTVHTKAGSIGVRGTDFWGGHLEQDETLDVVLLESEHILIIKNELGQVILDKAGFGTSISPRQAPQAMEKWSQKKLNKAFATVALE